MADAVFVEDTVSVAARLAGGAIVAGENLAEEVFIVCECFLN